MAVIYRITNMANNKYYIGSAESFARREWQHKYDLKRGMHKNPRLQAAWNKYGEEMFVFEVIEEVPDGINVLQIEDTYLFKIVGNEDCYNINTGAESPRTGIILSDTAKQNISVGRKGKHAGKNHYRYGKTVSDEVKKKISDAQRGKTKAPGRKVSETGKAKIKAAVEAGHYNHWSGKKHTEEAKAKMSKRIICITDNIEFISLSAALQHYSMTMPTLRRALLSDAPITKGRFEGLWFRYL